MGVGTLLASVFRATPSSCAVRYEEEDDRGVTLHCIKRLCKVKSVLLDLVNCMHFYFCIAFYWCFDVRNRVDLS